MAEVAEIKEVQEVNMMDYVTIPVAKFEELITASVEKKVKKKYKAQIKELSEKVEQYRRWWNQEESKSSELRKNLDAAKALIREKLGIDPDTERIEVEDAES
jgi:hypothetical protein